MRNDQIPAAECCTPGVLSAGLHGRDLEAELAALAKALAHPARIRILRVLMAQESCIAGDLQAEVGLAASTVSQHLKSLKEAGWVQGEVDGPRRCYCISPATRKRFQSLLGEIL